MKPQLFKLMIALGSVVLLGTSLSAQSYRMGAAVPFAFHANGCDLSAGRYVIKAAEPFMVTYLQNESTGNTIAVSADRPRETGKGQPRLVFHRYGGDYFLAEIWTAEGRGERLPVQRLEKKLIESSDRSEVAEVSIGLMAIR